MRLIREENSTRLRASLRGTLPAVGTLVLFLVGFGLLGTAFESVAGLGPTGEVLLASFARMVLYAVLVGTAVWWAARLERRTYADFGLNVDANWGREFAVGAAISGVAVAASLWWAGVRGSRTVDLAAAGVRGPGGPLAVAAVFAALACFFLFGNVYEELVYRRIVLRNFLEGLAARGVSPAVAVVLATAGSLALFGAYHVPLRGNLLVAVDAALVGVPFALAYLLTDDLGLPVGIHFGRLPVEFVHGTTLGEFEVLAVVELTRNTLAANLELKLVRLGLVCLLVLAWVYLDRGEIRTERIRE